MGRCPYEGIYGALPQTPPAFLKKAGEKQCLTAEHPTHSVRALFGGLFFIKKGLCLGFYFFDLWQSNTEKYTKSSSFAPLFSERKAGGEAPLQYSRTSKRK